VLRVIRYRVESFRNYDGQMVDCIDGWCKDEPPRKLAQRKRRSPDAAQRAALALGFALARPEHRLCGALPIRGPALCD
jgi:hypothetical protein